MVDDNDRPRETIERTTIVETDRGSGSGGVLAAVLLLLALLALLFLFRNELGFGGNTTKMEVPDKIDVNIN